MSEHYVTYGSVFVCASEDTSSILRTYNNGGLCNCGGDSGCWVEKLPALQSVC